MKRTWILGMAEDVPPSTGSSFYDYIARLSIHGVISDYPCNPGLNSAVPCVPPQNLPYFRPNANVTRGQIAKIVVNTAVFVLGWTLLNPGGNTFEDVPVGSTFFQFVELPFRTGYWVAIAAGSHLPVGVCHLATSHTSYRVTTPRGDRRAR